MRRKQLWFLCCLYGSIACSVISTLPILLIPAVSEKGAAPIVFSLLFWLGLAAEQGAIWTADRFRRQLPGSNADGGRMGLLSPWKTIGGKIADVVFCAAIVLWAVCAVVGWGSRFAQYLLIFLAGLSFRLHCILNGVNFRYQKFLKRKVEENA